MLNEVIKSLVQLRDNIDEVGQIEEGHIEWLATDVQALAKLLDKWESAYYE